MDKLRQTDVDFLTDESTKTDSQFTIEIIVRRDDTPKDLIPEEFKEKPAEEQPKKP